MFNSSNKVNAINLNYPQKLGLKILKTNIEAQKMNSSTLEVFEMMIADFQIKNKIDQSKFF